ncbi:hypothetical protein LTR08_008614 [Meristemomyces frigidus]|nr:hypothetical protein LTR08_008614 [Meristemomyces frigidus]
MAVLSFSLLPEATGRVYELLVCLAKFGETAYASFALDAKTFFIDYDFSASSAVKGGDRFTCQLLNRVGAFLPFSFHFITETSVQALQSVFKGRVNDIRGRETTVERCDVSIQDRPDRTECRLVVKMLCKHGMTKTYRLTYESVEVMHALFDRTAATQGWRIASRVLREYIEFFGPKTEQLDLLALDGKTIFTSFTEKITDGKGKCLPMQPLETAIAIHTEDFEDFHMQEQMHIVISVKDFKAIVTHAETLRGSISAHFSLPTRPLQFSYQSFGMHCDFTLMTTGDLRGASSTPKPKFITTRSSSRQPSVAPTIASRSTSEMPPPARPTVNKPFSSQSQRLPAAKAQVRQQSATETDPESDSLFLPGDEDQTWDPPNYNVNDGEEMLGWDANNEHPSASFHPTFRDSGSAARPPSQQHQRQASVESQEGLEPTQRLSQMHAMFD